MFQKKKIDLRSELVASLRRLAKAANSAASAVEKMKADKKEDGDEISFKEMFDCVRPHAKDLFSFGMVYSALKRAASGK